MLSSLMTWVPSLGPTWWEERTYFQRLSSDLHTTMHTCSIAHIHMHELLHTKQIKKIIKKRKKNVILFILVGEAS